MAAKKDNVNLDALIPREDLNFQKAASPRAGGIPITDLSSTAWNYSLLRKPHFQRETDDWSIDHIVTLLKSYRDGHLIPAVILWNAIGYTFVIDGAHRLSAFIAWVNDDYGDRGISDKYFKFDIPKRQKQIAQACRERVRKEVGTYSEISHLAQMPVRTPTELAWSTNLAKGIECQWVLGDAEMAATSFLAINQRAVQIDPTERYMIQERKAPNVIAARALVKSAKGHAYWGQFEQANIDVIESKARKIYNAIFEPEDAVPGVDAELQPAGSAHTANGLRMALDLVNIANNIQGQQKLDDDGDGAATARFIEKTYGVVKYIAGSDPASLGLHPAVYFWAETGNHRPSIFLAVVAFIQELVARNDLIRFTTYRAKLEEFLVGNSSIGKHLLGKHGGWKKSVAPIKKMLHVILDGLASGKTNAEIETEILQNQKSASQEPEILVTSDRTVWRETKATLRHKASLESATRCAICKARLVISHASDDHIERRVDGGSSDAENAQLTHRYCNHGFKEHFSQKGLPLPVIATPT
jgi:hypothetical protein